MIFICGSHTSKKKPCLRCKHFLFWGVASGWCGKHHADKVCNDHCKYYKRDSYTWTKDGICKIDESELYG